MEDVAPEIITPPLYHWYDGNEASELAVNVSEDCEQSRNANDAPCAILAVGIGLTITVLGTLGALEHPKAFFTINVNVPDTLVTYV